MNRKYNIIFIALSVMVSVVLSACEEDYFGKNASAEDGLRFAITANTAFSGVESRAVYETGDNFTKDDVQIDNYCFLLFDNNKYLIRAFDLLPEEMASGPYYIYIPAPMIDNSPWHAYLLGNVTLDELFKVTAGEFIYKKDNQDVVAETMSELYGQVQIKDLKNRVTTITRQYNKPDDEEKNKFTWSGYLKMTSETKELNFKLNPNVAKLTATIKNMSTSGSKLMSVRLKNVADKVAYAQNALNKSGNSTAEANDVTDINYIKYDMEYLEIAQGGEQTISWYVPQNKQGSGNRVDNAPANATYLEIDGVKMPNYITSAYRVYPGANPDGKAYADLTDFNISADTIYNMTVTIKDDGIVTDVNNLYQPAINLATTKVKLPPNSNCYMIHPIGDRLLFNAENKKNPTSPTVYEIPIDRVNQYWKDVKNEPSRVLDAGSEWTVEVIWQDISTRAISFCDEYGNGASDTYSGKGLNPFCFRLEDKDMAPEVQTYGNVLVGLKKANVDGYLWSWHLWITDYNPDAAPKWSVSSNKLYATNGTSNCNIDLQGCCYGNRDNDYNDSFSTNNITPDYNTTRSFDGNVQHYSSMYSGYNSVDSYKIWTTGIYKDKWIMDRNIGAMSSNLGDIENALDGWGMYYQFGRKDPFSYKLIYNIKGERIFPERGLGKQWIITTTTDTKIAVADGVKNPLSYYTASGEWASDATNYDWYSPTQPVSDGAKTLFDPCPAGWRVPKRDAFDFAGEETALKVEGLEKYIDGGITKYRLTGNSINNVLKTNIEMDHYFHGGSNFATPHTACCVYVDVRGKYNSSTDYDDRTKKNYNFTLDGYRDPYRLYAVIYSTMQGVYKPLKSNFPMQGNVDGGTGEVVKLLSENQKPLQDTSSPNSISAIWYDYYCWTAQGCYWTVEKPADGLDADARTGGNLIHFFTTTYGNYVNGRQERRNGRLFLRFHGELSEKHHYWTSRGHNVRCIQE